MTDVICSQADGARLPDWLTMSHYLTKLAGSVATQIASAVTVVSNYAYVADLWGGLKIINVSDKIRPILVGSIATQNAMGVTVVGNYAYVADGFGGLKIIDVSDKTSPTLVGNITTLYVMGVTVVGNYAICAGYPWVKNYRCQQ